MNSILMTIAVIVVFVAVLAALTDRYLILRKRSLLHIYQSIDQSSWAPVPGIDAKGELTTGAKYAILNYMGGLLVVGGAIIALVSGAVGYMINGLAREEAIRVALDEMQKPLGEQMAKLADARAGVEAVVRTVSAQSLVEQVAKELANVHADAIRGKPGLAGQNGKDGVNGTSPSAEAVATALFAQSRDQLRGPAGPAGQNGKDGPGATEVAELLVSTYGDQLRGAQGTPGKDGKDGISPSVDDIATQLAGVYRDELRGVPGERGKDGDSPSADAVAAVLVSQYRDQLVGAEGVPGKDGKDGASPSVEEVAAMLVSKYGVALVPK